MKPDFSVVQSRLKPALPPDSRWHHPAIHGKLGPGHITAKIKKLG